MASVLFPQSRADEPHQCFLLNRVDLPQLLEVEAAQAFPSRRLVQFVPPTLTEQSSKQGLHFRSQPGLHVNAIGNGVDRRLIMRLVREQMSPHAIGDLAVENADTIGIARRAEGERTEVERLIGFAVIGSTQVEDCFNIRPQALSPRNEIAGCEAAIELLIARWHRRVSRKDRRRSKPVDCRVEIHSSACHLLAKPLQLK